MSVMYLLIGDVEDEQLRAALEDVLKPPGKVSVASDKDAMDVLRVHSFRAIFVDASIVEEFGYLTSQIRMKQQSARVIVLAASSSWQLARIAFRAGASDYILKSFDRKNLEVELNKAIERPVLPWPR